MEKKKKSNPVLHIHLYETDDGSWKRDPSRYLYSQFIAVLFKNKYLKYHWDKQRNKRWYIHTKVYSSLWKQINSVVHCILDKSWGHYTVKQASIKGTNIIMIPFTTGFQTHKARGKSSMVVARGWERKVVHITDVSLEVRGSLSTIGSLHYMGPRPYGLSHLNGRDTCSCEQSLFKGEKVLCWMLMFLVQ